MEIIAFGDIHMSTDRLSRIKGLRRADLVIVTGDLTNFGSSVEARRVLTDILGYNGKLLCLAGNMDNSSVNDYLDDLGINLHGQAQMVGGRVCVFGVGASNPTPFNTPWELSEEQLKHCADEARRQAKKLMDQTPSLATQKIHSIMVSHAPPIGTGVDRLRDGRHVGSRAIRRLIEECRPDYCLSGHIHESAGCDCLGTTILLNPGMLAGGGWATITLNDNDSTYSLQ